MSVIIDIVQRVLTALFIVRSVEDGGAFGR